MAYIFYCYEQAGPRTSLGTIERQHCRTCCGICWQYEITSSWKTSSIPSSSFEKNPLLFIDSGGSKLEITCLRRKSFKRPSWVSFGPSVMQGLQKKTTHREKFVERQVWWYLIIWYGLFILLLWASRPQNKSGDYRGAALPDLFRHLSEVRKNFSYWIPSKSQ